MIIKPFENWYGKVSTNPSQAPEYIPLDQILIDRLNTLLKLEELALQFKREKESMSFPDISFPYSNVVVEGKMDSNANPSLTFKIIDSKISVNEDETAKMEFISFLKRNGNEFLSSYVNS